MHDANATEQKSMSSQEIVTTVTHHIRSIVTDKEVPLEPQTTLITNGLIDSLALIDLISALEKEFSISFLPEEMIPDHFDSISAISNLIHQKRGRS